MIMALDEQPGLNDDIDLAAYEPYDLDEIPRIIRQAEKTASKVKTLDIKIRHLTLALEKTDFIIKNSLLVYRELALRESIDDPKYFQDGLEQAQVIRKRLEIKLKELQLLRINKEEPKPDSPKTKDNESPQPKPPVQEAKPHMNVKELSDYTGLSTSTIGHKALKGVIPSVKIDGRRIYIKAEIDEWLKKRSEESK
jgi:excisionase family DNA binding protein